VFEAVVVPIAVRILAVEAIAVRCKQS